MNLENSNIELLHEEVKKHEELDYWSNIKIKHGDLLKTNWADADILYISSVWFSDEMLEGINEMSNSLKVGTRIITLRTLPPNPKWKTLKSYRSKMSWGSSEAYLLEKTIK